MESLPVTLIVKAPNQQIEDQKIKCELSWTINKLKLHLSEVYPSQPPHHEQKLIYSGQLLNDSVILKDVLRQYEGQDTHTLHLVCTPKYIKMNKPKQTPVVSTSRNEQSGNSSGSRVNISNQSTQSTVPDNGATERIPNIPWGNLNAQPMPPMDMSQYQMQMALMQQAYIQYMTQYMQMTAGGVPPNVQLPQTSIPHPTIPNAPNEPENQEQPQQPQDGARRVPPAAAAEDNAERDWLDLFYMLSRAMVLFSVVYFYSSPIRFVFVVFLGLALYLYQIGFFRNINNNNNHISGPPNAAPQEEQAPTRFMVVWTFFTTFFASLIPEIPNAI